MNTRRKVLQAKVDNFSGEWHVMHEAFHPIFAPTKRAEVEYWFNLVASANQRDQFRIICAGIYRQDPAAPDPTYAAEATAVVERVEVELLIKHYGEVLSEGEGKLKTRVWLLHCGRSMRDRDNFRSVFTGCRGRLPTLSVMKADYMPPETESYPRDKTHFVRSVDWSGTKGCAAMQSLDVSRRGTDTTSTGPRASAASAAPIPPAERFTKPKNQFDDVNLLAPLGYGDVPMEQAVAELKAKQSADKDTQVYYADKDGSTVFRIRTAKWRSDGPAETGASGGGILAAVCRDPMTRWVHKTCE